MVVEQKIDFARKHIYHFTRFTGTFLVISLAEHRNYRRSFDAIRHLITVNMTVSGS